MKKIILITILINSIINCQVANAAIPIIHQVQENQFPKIESCTIENRVVTDKTDDVAFAKKFMLLFTSFLLGNFGIHRIQAGHKKTGLLMLLSSILGVILLVVGATISAAGGLGIIGILGLSILIGLRVWGFVDFVRILINKFPILENAPIN